MARKAKKRRYSRSAGSDVESEMRRYKKGTAKSGRGGRGGRVKSRKQAIAIGLVEGTQEGQEGPEESLEAEDGQEEDVQEDGQENVEAQIRQAVALTVRSCCPA